MHGGDIATVLQLLVQAIQRPEPAGALGSPGHLERLVTPSARGMDPAERIEVYREQFWIRHLGNLADDFPTLGWAIGGADALAALSREYVRAHPPSTWDLQRLGRDMPLFVERHARWGRDARPRDAARLDWAFMEVFDAPDSHAFDPGMLAVLPESAWASARIELPTALRLLRLGSPLHLAREAVREGREPGRIEVAPTQVVIWRDSACFLRTAALPAEPFALLESLGQGLPLGEACHAVVSGGAEPAEAEQLIGAWFRDWTSHGWIASVRAPPTSGRVDVPV